MNDEPTQSVTTQHTLFDDDPVWSPPHPLDAMLDDDDRNDIEDDEPELSIEEALTIEQSAAKQKAAEQPPQLAAEPLFSVLLKRTLAKTNPNDAVLRDYVRYVIPSLSAELAHHTAKGGNFAEARRAEGHARVTDYKQDQSLRAHLVNGLFPVTHVARTLAQWQVPAFIDDWDEVTYRMLCAGYTMHDWGKLPGVQAELTAAGLDYTVSVAPNLSLVEDIVRQWSVRLGLDTFLAPVGGLDMLLHDLIYIASNTQRQWGTLRNISALPNLQMDGRSRQLATDLSRLADLIAYVARTPAEVVVHPGINKLMDGLSDGKARLTHHHLADVRGVVTNLINNAAMVAFAIPDVREPLLYAPSGVVYIERSDAPAPPAVADVAEKAIETIRQLCGKQLKQQLTGYGRDGKGLKHADFYWLFFTPQELPAVAVRAAMVRIASSKPASTPKRYAKMRDEKMVPPTADMELPDDIRVDQLAELCAMLASIVKDEAPSLDATTHILTELSLEDIADVMKHIPAKGGTPYPWYYAAGVYCKRNPGLSDQEWEARLTAMAKALSVHLPNELSAKATGWDVMRRYVAEHLSFGTQTGDTSTRQRIADELNQYINARKTRNASVVCSLCHAPYEVAPQQEAAILFAPQVYTNKQPLHGSKAIRHMCAVCAMELMLRQVMMNTSNAVGKRFEGRLFRYLFFYPSYFFTTETLGMLRELQVELKRLSFSSLAKVLLPDYHAEPHVNLSLDVFQRIQDLLLDPTIQDNPSEDRIFRMRYDEHVPMTFSFLGIPPVGRDAKEAEAWIQPAFLALVLPLLLDIKVVASESMLPIINEATELPETVLFDSAHAFVGNILGSSRLNLDELGHALQRLVVAYIIHLDGNANRSAGGFDYKWHTIPPLARNLASSPIYAFHYLKKWQRREKRDGIDAWKASLYLHMVNEYLNGKDDPDMTHARNITELYRRFYRAEKLNSNNMLRPLTVAAKAMLDADTRLFDSDDALEEAVRGKLHSFMENVSHNRADGRLPKGSTHESRGQAIDAFSAYIVHEIYRKAFGGDRAALRGKQLNLLKNACETLYLDAWRNERADQRVEQPDETTKTTEVTDEAES